MNRRLLPLLLLVLALSASAASVSPACTAELGQLALSNPDALTGLATDVAADVAKRKVAKATCVFGCNKKESWKDGVVKGACFGELSKIAESNPTAMKDVLAQVAKDAAKQKANSVVAGTVGSVLPGAARVGRGVAAASTASATPTATATPVSSATPATVAPTPPPPPPKAFGEVILEGVMLPDTAAKRRAYGKAFAQLLVKNGNAQDYQKRLDTIAAYAWAMPPNTQTLFRKSTEVLHDWILELGRDTVRFVSQDARVTLGNYHADIQSFSVRVQNMEDSTAPFSFSGTVKVPAGMESRIDPKTPGMGVLVQFLDHSLKVGGKNVYLLPVKLLLVWQGLPLETEGGFQPIEKYISSPGFAKWDARADSILQMKPRGLAAGHAFKEDPRPASSKPPAPPPPAPRPK
jgi:hypothetical protein